MIVSPPPWDERLSDGCSVPRFLRRWLPSEPPAQCDACRAHDRDYYYGGTRSMRRMADEMLRRRLIAAGMRPAKAALYWGAVRLFGGPALHRFSTWLIGRPQAWGYGGGHFVYTG